MKRRDLMIAGGAVLALPWAVRAQQQFPNRSITWVVGFPPGGGADGVDLKLPLHKKRPS